MNDAPHTIPEHIAERVAKLVNAAEDMRQQAADDLKQIYADLREELRGMGWNGAAASAEIAGFKGAIVELRLDEQAKAKREAKGDRIDVYADMLRLAGARARVREGRSYADAKLVETVAAGVQTEIGRTALTAAIDAMLAVDETAAPEAGEIIETQESSDGMASGSEHLSATSANQGESDAKSEQHPAEYPEALIFDAGQDGSAAFLGGEHQHSHEVIHDEALAGSVADEISASFPHSTVATLPAIVEQPEAPNSSPATSGANSRVAHVDDFDPARDMPSFLRRTDKGAMSGVEA